MSDETVQVQTLDQHQLSVKDEEISKLVAAIEEKQKRIDDLEKQVTNMNAKGLESEALKKIKFDNQILMTKLS